MKRILMGGVGCGKTTCNLMLAGQYPGDVIYVSSLKEIPKELEGAVSEIDLDDLRIKNQESISGKIHICAEVGSQVVVNYIKSQSSRENLLIIVDEAFAVLKNNFEDSVILLAASASDVLITLPGGTPLLYYGREFSNELLANVELYWEQVILPVKFRKFISEISSLPAL